jgi:cell division protein FtsB
MALADMSEAEFQAYLASLKGLPSLPELKRGIDTLAAALEALMRRVAALEREVDDLRKRELLRFWDDTERGQNGR